MPDRRPVPTDEGLKTPRVAALAGIRGGSLAAHALEADRSIGCAVSGHSLVSNLRSGAEAGRTAGRA
jgi:hypothetical protein